jgi:hypothetical protein
MATKARLHWFWRDLVVVQAFFLTSLALAALAVGSRLAALGQISHSTQIIAASASAPEQERSSLTARAGNHLNRGHLIDLIGLAVALTSAGLTVISARRHEPAWRPACALLLGTYLLLWLVMV